MFISLPRPEGARDLIHLFSGWNRKIPEAKFDLSIFHVSHLSEHHILRVILREHIEVGMWNSVAMDSHTYATRSVRTHDSFSDIEAYGHNMGSELIS